MRFLYHLTLLSPGVALLVLVGLCLERRAARRFCPWGWTPAEMRFRLFWGLAHVAVLVFYIAGLRAGHSLFYGGYYTDMQRFVYGGPGTEELWEHPHLFPLLAARHCLLHLILGPACPTVDLTQPAALAALALALGLVCALCARLDTLLYGGQYIGCEAAADPANVARLEEARRLIYLLIGLSLLLEALFGPLCFVLATRCGWVCRCGWCLVSGSTIPTPAEAPWDC